MKMKSKSVREFFKLVGRAIVRDWDPKDMKKYEASEVENRKPRFSKLQQLAFGCTAAASSYVFLNSTPGEEVNIQNYLDYFLSNLSKPSLSEVGVSALIGWMVYGMSKELIEDNSKPRKIGYYEALFHAGTLTIMGGDFERASVYSRRAISNAGKIPRISPLEDSYYTLHITRLNTLLNPHCNIQLLPYNPSF